MAFTIRCEQNLGSSTYRWDVFARCGYCHRGIVATFRTANDLPPSENNEENRKLLSIAPPFPHTGAPIHTPENVARFFKQGMENLSGNYDAAGSMFRKALDAGLKSKFPKMKD